MEGPYRKGKAVDPDAERRKHAPSDGGVIHVGSPTKLRIVEGHVVDEEGRILHPRPMKR
jgi:hypothetical protein